MNNFAIILSDLQAAIARCAARERSLTLLLVAVWGRVARMRARLERLIALWRAGTLPKPRKSRAGEARGGVRTKAEFPDAPGWLLQHVREAGAFGSQLAHLLSEAECAEFLAAVPQAGRIIRPLLRMLEVGVTTRRVRKARPGWPAPTRAAAVMADAGLAVGPGGRLVYV